MAFAKKLKDRYEIREVLGQGGMGVVYKAYDTLIRREVALKTLLNASDQFPLQLFYKECDVLASMSHPNIVEIFDIGEYEEGDSKKPFFVMPLLPGTTLDKLIKASSQRLTVERSIEIIVQTCRGLQAAHERGLVHRDLKPSNIFVMEDDSVKIIDFGVAHVADSLTTRGQKGTLLYMAPEQIELKPVSAASDIFSLGVVAYETLTRRRPFTGPSDTEIARAILSQIPPPVSDLNPAVNQSISRVIHKSMAKQPWQRFASAREFGETLQKAQRNEPIEIFDPARIQPRIQRATKAFEQGDLQFAGEILGEMEAEGHLDPAISQLRRQLDNTVRQKTIAQLLESARRRFEEEEFPLALQKVQEALQLDPENAGALGLRDTIENTRSEHKIEDWFRLAQQHAANHAYSHARQALENVLQLKPSESRALEMLSAVDRREQEYLKQRNAKMQLYQSAREAWEHGEVSTALSNLERVLELDRVAPDTSESGAGYQNFYNQVRTEQTAVKNAYDEARAQLQSRNYPQALAICNEYLKKYPGHALFQALKFDIEERQRQELSARIAEIDRRVETEPDLERRVSILKEAVESYPDEPHFDRMLRLVRDKRDLVNSIVAKSHLYEERGQYAEALAQLEILETIYSQYPGLNFEKERLVKRRDQKARSDARGRWVEQIDSHLASADYQRAASLLENAKAEFPGDSELAHLEELTRQGMERSREAQGLMERGRALCSEGKFGEGVEVLRQAYQADERNAVIRNLLLNTLVEQARRTLDTDWQGSAALLQQALALDPDFAPAKGLRVLVSDRQREESVGARVAEARKAQAAGDLEGALAEVQKGLSAYPHEPRLTQLQMTLTKALEESQRKTAVREAAAGSTVHQEPAPAVLAPPAPGFASSQVETSALPLSEEETRVSDAGLAPASQPPAATAPEKETPAPPPPAQPSPMATLKWMLITAFATAAVLGSIVGGVIWMRRGAHGPAGDGAIAVEIRTSPPGATIRIDNSVRGTSNLKLELPAGTYQIEATKEGYERATASLTAQPGSPAAADLPLRPLAPAVQLFTDLGNGKVVMDGNPMGELKDGQLVLASIPAGKHVLKLMGRTGEVTIPFESVPAALPLISGPLAAKDVMAVLVSNLGGHATIICSCAPAKVRLDDQPAGDVGPQGLELNNLSPGPHQLALGEGKDLKKLVVDIGPSPALMVFLNSNREVGTLVIMTGVDGVKVLLNGKDVHRTTEHGSLRLPNLDIKEYAVSVSKDGFQQEPEQRVQVRKGEETKVEFVLRPVPTVATLLIHGDAALAGVQVLLDKTVLGAVKADGTFSAANISPGDHTIQIQKPNFKTKQFARSFKAGETVQLSGSDVVLEAQPVQAVQPKPVEAPPAPVKSQAPAQVGMAGWEDPGSWKQENNWWIHKGGKFVLLRATPVAGLVLFTGARRKGRRMQWLVHFTDEKNYELFQLDDKNFYHDRVQDGKTKHLEKVAHGNKAAYYTLQIEITPNTVTHKLQDGGSWAVLEKYEYAGGNLTAGKFGFYLPGSDEIGISNFSFAAK
jgi:serine/threonine-protein kinase